MMDSAPSSREPTPDETPQPAGRLGLIEPDMLDLAVPTWLNRLNRLSFAMLLVSICLMLFQFLFNSVAQAAPVPYRMVTATERGTYIEIGRDLARFVAPEAEIALEVLSSKGSADNIKRLRYDLGVKLAIVQNDVYQAYLDLAASGNADAARLMRPLRVLLPLYEEEIYVVVRADSPLQYLHDIKDQRINVGPIQSGTAMTATTLYRQMFGQNAPSDRVFNLSHEAALLRLTADRDIDVVVIVAGQPARLLAEMRPEARRFIRLLRLDPHHASSRTALQTYSPATIRSASYSNWLDDDVSSLAVKALLITYDYTYPLTIDRLRRFAGALCKNLATLQSEGHPKWRDVELSLPDLGAGWLYFPPTERVLRSCTAPPLGSAEALPAREPSDGVTPRCTQTAAMLGLCQQAH